MKEENLEFVVIKNQSGSMIHSYELCKFRITESEHVEMKFN